MSKTTVKEYKVNKDFYIECKVIDFGNCTKYFVNVYMFGLKFLDSFDGYEGFDKNAANKAFKEFAEKYKNLEASYL